MRPGRSNPEPRDFEKAALRGEPSYVWRAGQDRRLAMVIQAGGERCTQAVLENGCGVGKYARRLAEHARFLIGLEYDLDRAREAEQATRDQPNCAILSAAGEKLPFADGTFDLILSHEVLEHVQDDHQAVREMARSLKPGGRIALFVPNRGYPFETHGIFWRGKYHFGNIPLVNYLPHALRDRLAPHVRVYSRRDLDLLFSDLPLRVEEKRIIFGAYDNIIARWPRFGRSLRAFLQFLEKTPLRVFGLSHFWVIERVP